jgi:mono/diheme cytochrome c family protein
MTMKGKAIALAAVLVAGIVCSAALGLTYEPPLAAAAASPVKTPDPAIVARGAQLAAVGDCMVCHTAQGGKPFAGGRPIATPFGAIFTTNITPDAETGIGRWSLETFTRAMRKGVSRDGHLLYPAFPYPHFTHMTDGDIAAVYAYLTSREPVHAIAPANRIIFPLNFRPLIAGWNLLFLHQGEVAADAAQSTEWNRGRYLVDGLGHCAACHTPRNALGAEQSAQAFSGGIVDGWEAPALTTLLHAPTPWTHAQLVSYLRTGLASQHGAAAGPMLPVTHALADASEADVNAIATYLWSLQTPAPAAADVAAAPQSGSADQAGLRSGAVLFTAACASCHGVGAPMSTLADRPSLSQSTAVNAASPRDAVRLILDGIRWEGSASTRFMPSFAAMLTDAQIADLANYTRARYSTRAPWPALDANAVAKIRKESPTP